MVAPLSHCGLVKYESGFIVTNKKGLLIFVCLCRGWSGLNHLICESMLNMVGQVQYVERVLQDVVGVDPVCIGWSIWKDYPVVLTQSNSVRTQ